MNVDQLGASFEHNKTAILGTAAAAVVGFALYRRKQSAGSPAAAAPAQGVATVGAYSAGGQAAGMYGANAYDSSASDVYGLVQPQMEALAHQVGDLNSKLNAVPVSAAPASPIADSLLSPTYSGNYWHMGSGLGEFESDGSMLVYNQDQWAKASATPGFQFTDLGNQNVAGAHWTSTAGNTIEKNKALYPVPAPATATS